VAFAALGHPATSSACGWWPLTGHIEGFNRAVADVSLRRLVNFGMSPALKTAFEQVFSAPHIVKILLAELGDDRNRIRSSARLRRFLRAERD